MAGSIFQRNFHHSIEPNKKLFTIEMKEASNDLSGSETYKSYQLPNIPYVEPQIQGPSNFQGSVLSLASRSYIDQSDIQPLTSIHTCRYDECHKYHHGKDNYENPNSPLKNAILFMVVLLLFLWIVIYVLLNRFNLI